MTDQKKPVAVTSKKQANVPKSKQTDFLQTAAMPPIYQNDRAGHDGLSFQYIQHPSDEHHAIADPMACSTPFSAKDFFKDCPWLQIPEHRRANILIEPLRPRFGLLGGASSKPPKMTKLAALAAKRRQGTEKSTSSDSSVSLPQDDYTTSLEKLNISQASNSMSNPPRSTDTPRESAAITVDMSGKGQEPPNTMERSDEAQPDLPTITQTNIRGPPSAFASIMTSHDTEDAVPASPSLLPRDLLAKSFDFVEPSPDDVVSKAQNSKGRNQG
jgi:elongation factor 1 alpha-like protein